MILPVLRLPLDLVAVKLLMVSRCGLVFVGCSR